MRGAKTGGPEPEERMPFPGQGEPGAGRKESGHGGAGGAEDAGGAAFGEEAAAGNALDQRMMRRAIALARRGEGRTEPNPLVGAVIARDGRIIGEGFHRGAGLPHAEREALAACAESPAGATLYVTLEPCCHQGRTPPCTEAILAAGISRVVIGSRDPNPRVNGRGAALLRQGGIQVDQDFLRRECDGLNAMFFHYITSGTPYIALKYAMTADGKIAAASGLSRWITGEEARREVHRLRGRYPAIMAGIGTVLADDPLLTCRLEGGRNPLRVICDSRLAIPLTSRICRTAAEVATIVACHAAPPGKRSALGALGATVLELPGPDGRVDLTGLARELGRREISGVLVEGGAELNYSLLEAGLARRVYAFIGARLFGGRTAKTPVGGQGVRLPEAGFCLTAPRFRAFGRDALLEYQLEAPDGLAAGPPAAREGEPPVVKKGGEDHVHRNC